MLDVHIHILSPDSPVIKHILPRAVVAAKGASRHLSTVIVETACETPRVVDDRSCTDHMSIIKMLLMITNSAKPATSMASEGTDNFLVVNVLCSVGDCNSPHQQQL